MKPSNPSSTLLLPPARPAKTLVAAAVAAFVGFADSAYLTADHYLSLPLPCSLLHGCEVVLHSTWSMVGPVPLAAIGVLYYLAVLFSAVYLLTSMDWPKHATKLFFLVTLAGLIMSVVFESMQVFIIHALCQYCALSALMTLVLASLGYSLWRSRPLA